MSRWSRVQWASVFGRCSKSTHRVIHVAANHLCSAVSSVKPGGNNTTSVNACAQAALDQGLILDSETQRQLLLDETYAHMAPVATGLVWPPEPLRSVLIRTLP